MARRRPTLGRRRGGGTAAPPVITVAPITLGTGLAEAYEWMTVDRPLGLRLASDWYAANVAKLLRLSPPDTDRQAHYAKAIKAKGLGDNPGATEGERATAWQMALRLYERAFPLTPGKIDLPTLAAAEKAATDEPTQRVKNVKTVLDNLNSAFNPVGVTYKPSATAERDFSEGSMWVPQGELIEMCGKPPLQLALAEAAQVAQVLSIVTVDAKPVIDPGLLLQKVPEVLGHLYAWAAAASSGSLVKPVGRVSGAPKTPRAKVAYVPTPGGCMYVPKPGSKTALILEMLSRPGGASVKEMSARVNFQAGATVSELRKKGMNIVKLPNGNFHFVS